MITPDRESADFSALVSTINARLERDSYVVVPAVDPARVSALRDRLYRLVKKDKSASISPSNFVGGPISLEPCRFQAVEKHFTRKADREEWSRICEEIGENVCILLTLLSGRVGHAYEVRDPATLFSTPTLSKETQGAHRDYPWELVQRLIREHGPDLFRAFGAVIALEDFGTRLRVWRGSHNKPESEINNTHAVDVIIPRAHALVFFDTTMHAGEPFLLRNLRQHLHLNVTRGRTSVLADGDYFKYARVGDL